MYIAPLNYDRFFKKVFSHVHIAKAFLEDFLAVTIQEIALLERTKHLTDESARVEIDFRCKINGANIIIEMQQWYKPDVIKRFYLYHCVSTALQLETLAEKKVPIKTEDKRAKDRSYKEVVPVLTLVWMVDDSLQFSEHFMGYTTAPETALSFLENHDLWEKEDRTELLDIRQNILKILDNNHKNLDFLRKNRLVFMFQENIIKDDKFPNYHRWFEFAEKTRHKNNKKTDFIKFRKEDLFQDIMRIIGKDALNKDDLNYIETEEEHIKLVSKALRDERESGFEEGFEEGFEMSVISLFKKGKTEDDISEWLDIPVEKVRFILEKAKRNGLL